MGDEDKYAKMEKTLREERAGAKTFEAKADLLIKTLKELKDHSSDIPDVRLSLENAETIRKNPESFEPEFANETITDALDVLQEDLSRLSDGEKVSAYAARKKKQARSDGNGKGGKRLTRKRGGCWGTCS